jgi:outer membrane protein OmpA-like peptidoglycan-associated protein
MKLLSYLFALGAILFAVCAPPARAQDNLKNQLFGEVNALLDQAKEKKADLFAPISFSKAMGYYNEAAAAYGKQERLEDIQEKVKNASLYFAKSLDQAKIADAALSTAMAARTDASSAGAPNYAAELWKKGEEQFNRAARSLEEGSIEDARKRGSDAETLYRAAELEAIKSNYLSPARTLMKQAEEMGAKDNAPKTYARAQQLAAQVEALLKQNRYDTDEARTLAQESKYEAAHAIYLHRTIAAMKQNDKTYEDAILDAEAALQGAAGAAGIVGRFDDGYKQTVGEISAAIRERDAKLRFAADSLRETAELVRGKESEIENLKARVASMENRVGSLTEAERQLKEAGNELQKKLNSQRDQEETIRQVSAMFTDDEGNVLRDGNNIILRLYGLSFPVGKNVIEPQYYNLLTKVQDAIKKFPQCTIMIEGHTDSQGSDEANQALSESRARATAEYLMANMGVEIPIKSQGYGESRPVASNDTPEGRAKNRRIDVVITPSWAGQGK